MGQRKTINEKRLTKKQVQDLINDGGQLHHEYMKSFKETYDTGYIKQDLVYELPNGQFLFVFDPNDSSLGGKGDIYSKDYFLRLLKSIKRTKDDYANNRASSISHWRYYSKYQTDLISCVDDLILELAQKLQIDLKLLDKSNNSLDLVSERTELYNIDKAVLDIYDNLVAYVGEVIRKKVKGQWKVYTDPFGSCPYIDVNVKNALYMPINIVWENLRGPELVDLRKGVGNEARRVGSIISFEKNVAPRMRDFIGGQKSGI